jgi:hypothetical protein
VIVFGGKPVHKFEGGFYSVFIGDGDEFPKNVAFAKFIKPNGIVYPDPVALKHLSPPDLDFIRKNYLDEEQFTRLMSTEDPPPPPGVQPQRRLPRPVPMSSRFPPRTL